MRLIQILDTHCITPNYPWKEFGQRRGRWARLVMFTSHSKREGKVTVPTPLKTKRKQNLIVTLTTALFTQEAVTNMQSLNLIDYQGKLGNVAYIQGGHVTF